MADVVKEFEEGFGKGGPRRAYQYAEWMDGKIRRFKSGKDFNGKINSFRCTLQQQAYRRGLATHSQVIDKDTLLFQAVPRNGAAK